MTETGKSSFGRILLLAIIYFLYIYSFQIPGLPHGIVFYRVAVVLLFAYTCMSSNMKAVAIGSSVTSKMVKKYLWWNVFLCLYVLFLLSIYGSGDGITPIPRFINMLIVLPLFFITGKYIFRNVDELMRVLYIGCVIQAIIIILATTIPALETALKLFFLGSSDLEELDKVERMISSGYNIGFQCFTSQGSLKMAVGEIGACYILMKDNGKKFFINLLLFLVITFASSLLSRTGLFISIACLLVVLLNKRKQGVKGYTSAIIIILIAYLLSSFILSSFSSNSYLSEKFNRYVSLFSEGGGEAYFLDWGGQGSGDNVIPPLSFETLIGLGIEKGVSGTGIRTIVDGGFLSNYSSIGLIATIINYLIIFSFIIRQYKFTKDQKYKGVIVIFLIILIMGEIKEHFVHQLYFMCLMFLFFYLSEKDNHYLTGK